MFKNKLIKDTNIVDNDINCINKLYILSTDYIKIFKRAAGCQPLMYAIINIILPINNELLL